MGLLALRPELGGHLLRRADGGHLAHGAWLVTGHGSTADDAREYRSGSGALRELLPRLRQRISLRLRSGALETGLALFEEGLSPFPEFRAPCTLHECSAFCVQLFSQGAQTRRSQ